MYAFKKNPNFRNKGGIVCFQILGYADHVFTGLFTIEIILKVVSRTVHSLALEAKAVAEERQSWLQTEG